jgi:hypothetical protein
MPATWSRWHKYGHDRLYVNSAGGIRLGYLDLADNAAEHLEWPERAAEFQEAVAAWNARGRPDSVIPAPRQSPDPPLDEPWFDLAENKPGESVAQLAAAYRRARPVTSRLEPVFGVHSDAQAWAKGAAGERATAKALRPLTHPARGLRGHRAAARWKVLHSVPLGDYGADIDHLLLGPAGVFAINTKNHHGQTVWVGPRSIKVNRYAVQYSRKASADAQRADSLLAAAYPGPPVDVWPVIAVVGAIVTGRPATAEGVLVANVDLLVNALSSYPEILPDAEVEALYAIARRSTTWTTMVPRHRPATEPVNSQPR